MAVQHATLAAAAAVVLVITSSTALRFVDAAAAAPNCTRSPPLPGMQVTLVNKVHPPVPVRLYFSCAGVATHGPEFSVLPPNDAIVVSTDFVAHAELPAGQSLYGDPFATWWGGGWQSAHATLMLSDSEAHRGYLEYTSLPTGGAINVWPLPATAVVGGGVRPLASNFAFATTGTSATLANMVERYTAIIKAAAATGNGAFDCKAAGHGASAAGTLGRTTAPPAAPALMPRAAAATAVARRLGDGAAPPVPSTMPITTARVVVRNEDESLGAGTNYSYSLTMSAASDTVTIIAESVYGAAYGMETLAQMIVGDGTGGFVNVTSATISDHAAYEHRGLMVDSGRRFAPVAMLKQMMDGMAAVKMSVLHLHLADWPGIRVEVPGLPEVTNGLNGQYYTTADVSEIVTYGQQRGIRILPELDVPGHSASFRSLESRGITFCDENKLQLFNDPQGVTMGLVKAVLAAIMQAFPEQKIHIGGDETRNNTKCSWENIHSFETELQKFVEAEKRGAIVWNEVFSDGGTEPNALRIGSMVQNWHGADSVTTTEMGFETLSSNYDTQYLDQQCCAAGNAVPTPGAKTRQCYWEDIAHGMTPTERTKLFGGETAMWGDMYCAPPACPDVGQFAWMYPPEQDAAFIKSFMGMVWPRAAAAAGAFWNYDASVVSGAGDNDFSCAISAINTRLGLRGVTTCPNGCSCDWGSSCGEPYGAVPPLPMNITLINKLPGKAIVKEAFPCQKTYGDKLATLEVGQQVLVRKDFIVIGEDPAGSAGDPFDVWFGGPAWRGVNVTFELIPDPSTPSYIIYNMTSPVPP